MGDVEVPADALWRAQTQRAVDNFPISGRPLPPSLVHALARIKAAAARANADLYTASFLREVHDRLAPGGVVALWSAGRSPELLETLAQVFAQVDEIAHEVRLQDREEQYWLYAGRRPAAAQPPPRPGY